MSFLLFNQENVDFYTIVTLDGDIRLFSYIF